jgi:hypothetical protein
MTDTLRDRIARALQREDARNWGYDHGFENRYGVDEETDAFVDAVLAVLPAPADQAADLAWGESLSASGEGAGLRVSIDVQAPGSETPAELALGRDAAAMLHAQLGDVLGLAPAPTDRAAALPASAPVCTCGSGNPMDYDGPQQDCPEHGDPRALGYCPLAQHEQWRAECERLSNEVEELRAELERRTLMLQASRDQVTRLSADRATVLREAIPAWEAVYEPGNVSDYLIGYANSEAAAKGAAEAWLRSQKDEVGNLEWVLEDQLASGRYERWYELLEHHPGNVDIGPGIIVRRIAAEEQQVCVHPEGYEGECPCPPSCICCKSTPATAPPTEEQVVRDHVTTVHLIGEQLTDIEAWLWERLADVRAASKAGEAPGGDR